MVNTSSDAQPNLHTRLKTTSSASLHQEPSNRMATAVSRLAQWNTNQDALFRASTWIASRIEIIGRLCSNEMQAVSSNGILPKFTRSRSARRVLLPIIYYTCLLRSSLTFSSYHLNVTLKRFPLERQNISFKPKRASIWRIWDNNLATNWLINCNIM